MGKKIFWVALVVLAGFFVFFGALARQAPVLFEKAISGSLDKKVGIGKVDYHFPLEFRVRGLKIFGEPPFEGKISFAADEIRFSVSPLSMLQTKLVIENIQADGALIVLRKFDHALGPPFLDILKRRVEIKRIRFTHSHFLFMDYDAEGGLAVGLDRVDVEVTHVFPRGVPERTTFRLFADLIQGRGRRAAQLKFSGWVDAYSPTLEAELELKEAHLPSIRSYYGETGEAEAQDGTADISAAFRLTGQELVGSVDLKIVGLLFREDQAGSPFFGLKAGEVLRLLGDPPGRLDLAVPFRWDRRDSSGKLKDILRSGVEASLKDRAANGLLAKDTL
ncbi:MAG: DUF748 domain-containing protein [Candidatus Omnitrophica bacterium]|nr:DUF748 domain-containing protein [Candidatus Omnitrophota bacterium]